MLCPEYLLMGEEMSEQEQIELIQTSDHGLWCLDPLDGTSNFAAGIPFLAFLWLVGRTGSRAGYCL